MELTSALFRRSHTHTHTHFRPPHLTMLVNKNAAFFQRSYSPHPSVPKWQHCTGLRGAARPPARPPACLPHFDMWCQLTKARVGEVKGANQRLSTEALPTRLSTRTLSFLLSIHPSIHPSSIPRRQALNVSINLVFY